MEFQNKKPLTTEQFVWTFFVEERVYMPPTFCLANGPEYYQYTISSKEFLASNPYSLWFTDPGRKKWLNQVTKSGSRNKRIDQKNLTPISFPELLRNKQLLEWKLFELRTVRIKRKKREVPHAITMYCTNCERRVLLDGNYGFLTLCTKKQNVLMKITEAAHEKWVEYNGRVMSGICICDKKET